MFIGTTVDMLSALFLICFGIGLVTSLGALLMGAHGHGEFSSDGDVSDVMDYGDSQAQIGEQLSYFNLNTMLGFLLGFGAAGFAAKQMLPGTPVVFILAIALFGGLVFAAMIYSVISKVLLRGQTPYLKSSDFNLVGVEGIVSSTIFAGRVGEVSYVLNKSHAAVPAREKLGRELKKGLAVVIVEVRNGVAIVLLQEEFTKHMQSKVE